MAEGGAVKPLVAARRSLTARVQRRPLGLTLEGGLDHHHVFPSVVTGGSDPCDDVPRDEIDQAERYERRGDHAYRQVHFFGVGVPADPPERLARNFPESPRPVLTE
jgi:hypothetical protein